jgi:hypothetical protein
MFPQIFLNESTKKSTQSRPASTMALVAITGMTALSEGVWHAHDMGGETDMGWDTSVILNVNILKIENPER